MEAVINKKLYEAMFLVDSAEAAADWDGVIKNIENILKKAEAEIVSLGKWSERRLAYDIGGKNRGTYILCYFRADGERIREIDREIRLSERIMRTLILSAEQMSLEDIEKQTPAMLEEVNVRRIAQEVEPSEEPEEFVPEDEDEIEQPEEEETEESEQ